MSLSYAVRTLYKERDGSYVAVLLSTVSLLQTRKEYSSGWRDTLSLSDPS